MHFGFVHSALCGGLINSIENENNSRVNLEQESCVLLVRLCACVVFVYFIKLSSICTHFVCQSVPVGPCHACAFHFHCTCIVQYYFVIVSQSQWETKYKYWIVNTYTRFFIRCTWMISQMKVKASQHKRHRKPNKKKKKSATTTTTNR